VRSPFPRRKINFPGRVTSAASDEDSGGAFAFRVCVSTRNYGPCKFVPRGCRTRSERGRRCRQRRVRIFLPDDPTARFSFGSGRHPSGAPRPLVFLAWNNSPLPLQRFSAFQRVTPAPVCLPDGRRNKDNEVSRPLRFIAETRSFLPLRKILLFLPNVPLVRPARFGEEGRNCSSEQRKF